MASSPRQGLFKKQTLADAALAEIKDLARLCEAHDRVDLRINWSGLENRSGDQTSDFLYYRDDGLIGFLTIDGLGSDEAEATGMVHPDDRRMGIFRALAGAAQEECRRNGTPALIFVFDHRSESARAFVDALGAAYVFAEHTMQWQPSDAISHVAQRLDFRAATAEDAAAIAGILAEDMGIDAHELEQAVVRNMRQQWYKYYVAALRENSIGTLNIQTLDGAAYIYGFVVRPEYRGRGYGREMLARTLQDILAERPQPVFLEVEIDNTPAFSLYRSFGFEVTTTYDYYRLPT